MSPAAGAAPGLLSFPGLERVPGLVHAVTTRAGGVSTGPYASLNLGRRSGDRARRVATNRRRVARALGFTAAPWIPAQVHGTTVVRVGAADAPSREADAVILDRPGVLVGVLGADCPGILLVAPKAGVLAVVHAGWRGVAGQVIARTLDGLWQHYDVLPDQCLAAIGPGIGGARYEVGPEVVEALASGLPQMDGVAGPGAGDRSHVDLQIAIGHQLTAAGVASIEVLRRCTFEEHDTFFSHRREGPQTGRHALVAGWRVP